MVKKKRTSRRDNARNTNRRLSDQYYYTGELVADTTIRLIQYNAQEVIQKEVAPDTTSLKLLLHPDYVNWIQVSGLSDSDRIVKLAKEFGLHKLDAKDILTPQHVVKVEDYQDKMLIVLGLLVDDKVQGLRNEHISIIVSDNVILTFAESSDNILKNIVQAIHLNTLDIRNNGKSLLLAFVLNAVVSSLVESIADVEESLEELEDILLDVNNDSAELLTRIQALRREYMLIRKDSMPLKEQFIKILRSSIIDKTVLPVYNDIFDQLQYIVQTVENCREFTSSLVDMYCFNNDYRMNVIMKRLTIVSTVFIPLTFLAGIWGMNFMNMPELNWKYGYAYAWGTMLLVGLFTIIYMKKKKWF